MYIIHGNVTFLLRALLEGMAASQGQAGVKAIDALLIVGQWGSMPYSRWSR